MEDLLQVGIISSTHGLRGEVKVFPTTDDKNRFKGLKEVILSTEKGQIPLQIEQVKFFKNQVILKFKGIDSIDDVEKYKGQGLCVNRENAVKCEADEYYIGDLIGIEAVDEQGESLGQVTDVLQTGANDVYVVSAPGKKELLLPAIKQCILSIDMEKRRMQVYVMPGLAD